MVVVYFCFAAALPDSFLSAVALKLMLRQTVIVALCAVGMTFVIALGGIDLSVGSVVALVTVVVARQLRDGSSVAAAIAVGVLTGLACGAFNGALTVGLRITPFIATLGTMGALRGIAKGLANEQKIDANAGDLPSAMGLASEGANPFPAGVWLAFAAVALGAALLARGRFGRHVVAIGSSVPAARLAGLAIGRTTILTYALLGALAGVAGVLEFATLTVGDPTDSVGLELSVIAAVVVGGGSLSGGRGSVVGSLIGALLMTVIKSGATYMGISNWIQEILTGAIIVSAVALDRVRTGDSA
jgi:ribose transport system permease protein